YGFRVGNCPEVCTRDGWYCYARERSWEREYLHCAAANSDRKGVRMKDQTMDIPRNLLEGWDIVVLDDEDDSLEVAEIILTEYGATVHTAANGKEGLEKVIAVKPRFVISDLSMPEMDGWGFINA